MTPVTKDYGRELANLIKLYSENDKYGADGDSLEFKLAVFKDLCNRASLPSHQYHLAYPTMLRGLPLSDYYSNKKNSIGQLSFQQIVNSTKHYFESPKQKVAAFAL